MSVPRLLTGTCACLLGAIFACQALAQDPAPKAVKAEELPAPAAAAPAVAAPDPRVPATPAPTPAPEQDAANAWRFKQHEGRWWYWLPSNRWVYWQNSAWVLDSAATDRTPVVDAPGAPPIQLPEGDGRAKDPANAWRFKMHEGRWWYYMPDQTWSVYSDTKNAWVKYDPATFAQEFPAPVYVSRGYSGGGYRGYSRSRANIYIGGGYGGYGGYPYGYGYPYGGYGRGFGYPYGGYGGYPYGGYGGYPYGGSSIYFGRGGGYYGGSGFGVGIGFN
jgi:hypothetical protein